MNKIFALILITIEIVYLVEKGESKVDCESYIADGVFYEAQNCSSHCCGNCKNRYCCTSHVTMIYQTQCRAENCTGYYDSFDNYVRPKDCASSGLFCCGWCGDRYCCDSTRYRINQSLCSVEILTTKQTTTKLTTTKLFSTTTLKTSTTKSSTSTVPKPTSLSTLFYVLGGTLILCVILLIVGIFHIRRLKSNIRGYQKNSNNNISLAYRGTQPTNGHHNNDTVEYSTNNNSQPNTSSAFVVADNSAYNYDKIYNPNINNDLPPSYDTIKLRENKTRRQTKCVYKPE